MTEEIEFEYFSSVHGRVVMRSGTDTFIGCKRGPKGYIWDTDKIVAIPVTEVIRYKRDYLMAVKTGDLRKRKKPRKKSTRKVTEVDADTFGGSKDQDDDTPVETAPKGADTDRRRRS